MRVCAPLLLFLLLSVAPADGTVVVNWMEGAQGADCDITCRLALTDPHLKPHYVSECYSPAFAGAQAASFFTSDKGCSGGVEDFSSKPYEEFPMKCTYKTLCGKGVNSPYGYKKCYYGSTGASTCKAQSFLFTRFCPCVCPKGTEGTPPNCLK